MGRTRDGAVVSRRLPFRLAVAVAVLCAAAAAVLVARGVGQPPSLDARVQQVAATLSCPACEAESVAASNAPIAQAMRSEIRQQLRQGQTPAQIRTWFRHRYGDQVVLLPGSSGPDLLLWGLPAAALVGGLVTAAVVIRRRRRPRGGPAPGPTPATALSPARLAGVAVLCAVVGAGVPAVILTRSATSQPADQAASLSASDLAPATVAQWRSLAGSLESQGKYSAAVAAWRKAVQLRPGSPSLQASLAFDLLRSGQPARAEHVARPVASAQGSQQAMALLVLGLAQRARHEPAAATTLHHFLRLYPDHPAAGQVRRLLREHP
ncbi:MAG TPA: cytochrome c-type biogenesis protein CcmH [Marmoricola sp.]|nr:cytochrome c-type biogenesis protein CcmH [Marmoricola sp.]